MKKLLLGLLLSLFCFNGFAQDPELLSNNWYFNTMTIDGEEHTPNFDDYFYFINLYFQDDGDGLDLTTNACDYLNSEVSYDGNNEFTLSNLTQTSEDCEAGFEDFKTLYFNFFYNNQENSFSYEIINDLDDTFLIITDLLGNKVYYNNKIPINPLLYQTWELIHIYLDLDGEIIISDINPPIIPNITISENLEYTGFGACNFFSGNFIDVGDGGSFPPLLFSENFEKSSNTCINEEHINVESKYFIYFTGWVESYDIYVTENDQFLFLFPTALGYALKFKRNNNLGSAEFIEPKTTIYPNPVSNTLFISSENSVIDSVTIYSLTGKKVFEDSKGLNSIDVSNLSKGMYFMEIFSEAGKTMKKFIKN